MRHINASAERHVFVLLLALSFAIACGCKTSPSVVLTTKTDKLAIDTIVKAKDLETTISDIKVITDKAKDTGEIVKEDTIKIIEYVDKSKTQVAELNAKLLETEKSRIEDNTKMGNTINEQSSTIVMLKDGYESARKKLWISIFFNIAFVIVIGIHVMLKVKKLITI